MTDGWHELMMKGGLPKKIKKILSQNFQNFRELDSRPSSYTLHRDNSNHWDISITLLIIRKLIVLIKYCPHLLAKAKLYKCKNLYNFF
jgi:hypothetical protein